MVRIGYTLTITTSEEPLADLAELVPVEEMREPGDSDKAAIQRWLGGKISHAEDALNDSLPHGWNVSIEFGGSWTEEAGS